MIVEQWILRYVGERATVLIARDTLSADALADIAAYARARIVPGCVQISPLCSSGVHDSINGMGGDTGKIVIRYIGGAASCDILDDGYTAEQLAGLAMSSLRDAGDGVRLEIAEDVSPASALFGFALISND